MIGNRSTTSRLARSDGEPTFSASRTQTHCCAELGRSLIAVTICVGAAVTGCVPRRLPPTSQLWPDRDARTGVSFTDAVQSPAAQPSDGEFEKPRQAPRSLRIRGQSPRRPPGRRTGSFFPEYPRYPMRVSAADGWLRFQSPAGEPPPAPANPSVIPEPVPRGPMVDDAADMPLDDLFLDAPGTADLDIFVEEARTGRFMFGAGVNSNAGLTGHVVIDERNFDIMRFPTSFQDFLNGTAFRGGGQGLRIEAVPGTFFERYVVNFTEPYLFWTPFSLNVSGFLFERRYEDWSERRKGARVGLGYRITHDLSVNASLRMAEVDIYNPVVEGVPELDSMVGDHDLYGGRVTLAHDTRDIPFLPTQGHLLELSFEQMFGSFDYPRGMVDYRQYFLIRERADGTNRHTLSVSTRTGVSGSQTPIFENFFAGGQSTLRGFDYRGASPVVSGVTVGGEFMLLGTVEYMFPLTADDMLKGVFFVDAGTVEENVEINGDNFRVSPGFGLRISIPALGPAPLAFDFAFPVASAPYDDIEHFSFFFGFGR